MCDMALNSSSRAISHVLGVRIRSTQALIGKYDKTRAVDVEPYGSYFKRL